MADAGKAINTRMKQLTTRIPHRMAFDTISEGSAKATHAPIAENAVDISDEG
jgi:hypothetical protein